MFSRVIAVMILASATVFTQLCVKGFVSPVKVPQKSSKTTVNLIQIQREELPGVIDEYFDPLGISKGASDRTLKRWRESESKHGRVAMLAVVGLLVQEVFHPLFGGIFFGAPIYYFQEIQQIPYFVFSFVTAIGIVEIFSIRKYWDSSTLDSEGFIDDDVIPGNLDFDPLRLSPEASFKTKSTYNNMRPEMKRRLTQELMNGRTAMIATAIIVIQELYTHKGVFPGTV